MGGAVKQVASTAKDVSKATGLVGTAAMAPLAAKALIIDKKSVGASIGAGLKPRVEGIKNLVGSGGEALGETGILPTPKVADPGTPVDPAAQAEADKKEKSRAKRQAEIDILTDRPGRGGTILTDQYSYKV